MRSQQVGLLLAAVILSCTCVQFTTYIQVQQKFCFYEVLDTQQKYAFSITPEERASAQLQVSHIDGREWRSVIFRTSEPNRPFTRIDKLASVATTYSYCVKNIADKGSVFKIQFSTGLEVMELHELPDASDGDNLERELNWLDQQTTTLSHRAENIEGLRRINYQINGMVGTKMIYFAIIGLAAIGVVNFAFFKMLRKTFKDRKLI